MINELAPQGIASIVKTLETFMVVYPDHVVHILSIFQQMYVSEPLASETGSIIQNLYLCLFARLAVSHTREFVSLIVANEARFFEKLALKLWIDKFDGLANPRWRKSIAMAFACLLATPELSGSLYPYLSTIFGVIWIESLTNPRIKGPISSYNNHENEDVYQDDQGTCDCIRRQKVASNDPINQSDLQVFLGSVMQKLWLDHGFRQAFGAVEVELADKIQFLLSPSGPK